MAEDGTMRTRRAVAVAASAPRSLGCSPTWSKKFPLPYFGTPIATGLHVFV